MRALFLMLAAGCASVEPQPAAEVDPNADFTDAGGCGDLVVYAVNSADTVVLRIEAEGLVEASGGADTTSTWSLPNLAVDVVLEVGDHVTGALCAEIVDH